MHAVCNVSGISKYFSKSLRGSLMNCASDALGFGRKCPGPRANEFCVLDEVDLTVMAGQYIAVMGANGSGKTTLMRLLAGFYRPDGGHIDRKDTIVSLSSPLGVMRMDVSVRENIHLMALAMRSPKEKHSGIIFRVLDKSGLGDRAEVPVGMLSTGMKVRLQLLTALEVSPVALLVDELIPMLDPPFRSLIRHEFSSAIRNGMTVVRTTHEIPCEEDGYTAGWLVADRKVLRFDDPVSMGREMSGREC